MRGNEAGATCSSLDTTFEVSLHSGGGSQETYLLRVFSSFFLVA